MGVGSASRITGTEVLGKEVGKDIVGLDVDTMLKYVGGGFDEDIGSTSLGLTDPCTSKSWIALTKEVERSTVMGDTRSLHLPLTSQELRSIMAYVWYSMW